MSEAQANAPCFRVLGVRVNAVQIPGVIAQMERWISERAGSHFIAVTGMHGVMEARYDPSFKEILNSADLVVPDGMPLVWLGRRQRYALKRRVYGPELLETFCRRTRMKYGHFFYGGAPGVAQQLAEVLQQRYGIPVVGTYSPPFRPLTELEEDKIIAEIRTAAPDVLWIGLSTPKQERWMDEHRDKLRVPVMVGVGAAFDLHTGKVKQAPPWMRERGLEWLFRLMQEPQRLWRRYLIYGSKFAWNASLELLRVRKFE